MKHEMTIVKQKAIGRDIIKMVLQGELATEPIYPGQFLHVRVQNSLDTLLRRPISICEVNPTDETISMIYRVAGNGTKALFDRKPGERLDVLGPLGNGFPISQNKSGDIALLVGGGIGVPPLYELSKRLKGQGVQVIHVLGFQSGEASFYINEFHQLGLTYIATEDGTLGTAGYVTNVLNNEDLKFDRLYACGPIPMLKALEEKYPNHEAYLSLEERMGCGVGACFACVRKTVNGDGKGYVKLCSDGPVFKAGEVIL